MKVDLLAVSDVLRNNANEFEPDDMLDYGSLVRGFGQLCATDGERIAFYESCGLRDARTEQRHACQPECDCACHWCEMDACHEC